MLHIFKHEWTSTFYLNEESTKLLLNMINLFSLTLSIEGAHMIIASILNAIGEHDFALNLSLIALYGVGILSGIYEAYFKEKGYCQL